jgi:hypothetical protein
MLTAIKRKGMRNKSFTKRFLSLPAWEVDK